MRILLYDVEAFPNTCFTWGLHNQFIAPNQIVSPCRVACWAAKFVGEKKIHFADERIGHGEMMAKLYALLEQADAVCHYNGISYDNKMVNSELIRHGFTPLPPSKQIDLLKVVKKNFRFPSNKLEYVAPALGIGEKVKHEGFGLWVACMNGNKAAWKRMKNYNCQDTLLLEDMYAKLRPWISNHPSHSLEQEAHVCPNCKSKKLQHRGYAYTKTCRYARLQCTECGAWSREKTNEVAPDNRKSIVVGL